MPFIQIHLAEGRSVEQKREIAAAVTADVSRIAEVSPDRVKIYFFDIKKEDMASGGGVRHPFYRIQHRRQRLILHADFFCGQLGLGLRLRRHR